VMLFHKKILLVSNGFYPEISPRSYRATELAKELFRQGHEVTVISKYRDHDYTEFLKEYPIRFKMWRKPILPQIPDFKYGVLKQLSRKVARGLSILFEYPNIGEMFQVTKNLKTESGYDLLISFAVPYPVHWGVARARTNKHRIAVKWVADCGDPYMGDVLDSFRKPFYFKFLEKSFCEKADFITIPVESARPGYYPEYHSKIRIIPQGFSFEMDTEISHGNGTSNSIPNFAYAGGFLQGIRDPEQLMKYLARIDQPFIFYVFTNQPELLSEYKKVLGEKLVISGYITRGELMKRLSIMDFLVNFDNNTTLNVPSKLIDYAIVGRPVLNIDKGLTIESVTAFLNGDYRQRLQLPDPRQYHIENVSKQFLGLL
jgi:hypothetical protein